MRVARILAAKDRAVAEAAANANASKLFAISAARAIAYLSSPKPAGQFCAVSVLQLVARNVARNFQKSALRDSDTEKTKSRFSCACDFGSSGAHGITLWR